MPFSAPSERVVEIDPSQLRPGLFIRLPSGWMNHPFLFNQFRIHSTDQVEVIQKLGLKTVQYLPERSSTQALPRAPETARPPPPPAAPSPAQQSALEEKRQRAERAAAQRQLIAKCEKRYQSAAQQIRDVMRNVFAAPSRSVVAARELVDSVMESFAAEAGLIIHLMGDKVADDNAYFHSLNVMILSLLVGRSLGLSPDELRTLGEGALFHDIGKTRVPDAVLRNPLRNRHEEEFFRLHTLYGADIGRELQVLGPAVIEVILSHHETMDGKGYPNHLGGRQISLAARIVAITNRYDNLCNPLRQDKAVTPAEAMTLMFKSEQAHWDPDLLQRFVRALGVYPPGSLVQLSNGNLGLVVAVDHADLLRPSVMIFDPAVPRNEALIVDLATERDVKVDAVVRPTEVDPAALAYLAPRRRLSYFHGNPT